MPRQLTVTLTRLVCPIWELRAPGGLHSPVECRMPCLGLPEHSDFCTCLHPLQSSGNSTHSTDPQRYARFLSRGNTYPWYPGLLFLCHRYCCWHLWSCLMFLWVQGVACVTLVGLCLVESKQILFVGTAYLKILIYTISFLKMHFSLSDNTGT